MKPTIVITAFGTSSKALDTYAKLDKKLQRKLPEEKIVWAYSSRTISTKLQKEKSIVTKQPAEVLEEFAAQGQNRAVLQSLHLFPGTEFHSLCKVAQESNIYCAMGLPLFTNPADFETLAELLRPFIQKSKGGFLILGHGTDHPSWTCYYTLEKILRFTFGSRVFVGVVEKYPDSSSLVDEISEKGFKEVTIFPLFLLAGMHYQRDIIGDSPNSWKNRLQAKGIEVTSIAHGVGLLPNIEDLIISHINAAKEKL